MRFVVILLVACAALSAVGAAAGMDRAANRAGCAISAAIDCADIDSDAPRVIVATCPTPAEGMDGVASVACGGAIPHIER